MCDIEVMEEATQSPSVQSNNEPAIPRTKTSSASFIKSTTYADVYSDTNTRLPVAMLPTEYNHHVASTSGNSTPIGNPRMATESRSFSFIGPSNPESSINSYLSTRPVNTVPVSPYGVVGAQNMLYNYGGVYSSVNGVCSPAELKAYTQYAMQENPSYPGRYFSSAAVSGNPIYTRNFYPANNGQYRNEELSEHQGFDRRFHSRGLGEHVPQPPMLGAQ